MPNSKSNVETANGDQLVTMTSGMEAGNTPEKGDFEIGLTDNGEGYLKLPIYANGDVERFTVPTEEVEAYRDRRNEITPIPSLPDGINREPSVEVIGDWGPGTAVNTGGGIYCRIWEDKVSIGSIEREHTIQVIYQLPTSDGVEIDVYAGDTFIGAAHTSVFDEHKADEPLQQEAKLLIEQLEKGEFDNEILDIINRYQQ